MGKNDQARLPTVNKTMFDNGNWQAFTAVINYIADLTVWAATTKEKGIDGKKYNLLWLLPRNRDGPDGRGMMDPDNFPLLDTEAHRNCHAKLYEQLYFNLNSLVPELVSKFPITDYDSEDPDKGYIDEKYTVATDLLWAFKDKYNKTSADTLNNELENITKLVSSFPGYPEATSNSYHRYKNWSETLIKKYKVFNLHPMAAAHEVSLVTKLIGAITKIEVNPNIAHPLPFSTVIQEMDAYYETGNQLDLLHYLTKLDSYILKFYERTQDSDFNIERPSAYFCQECFGPHNTKACKIHKNKCERQDINDQESENDDDQSESEDINDQESENNDEERDKQHSEYEDEMATSTQYNEMQCIKCSSTFDCPSTYHGNQPLCQGCSHYLHESKHQRF